MSPDWPYFKVMSMSGYERKYRTFIHGDHCTSLWRQWCDLWLLQLVRFNLRNVMWPNEKWSQLMTWIYPMTRLSHQWTFSFLMALDSNWEGLAFGSWGGIIFSHELATTLLTVIRLIDPGVSNSSCLFLAFSMLCSTVKSTVAERKQYDLLIFFISGISPKQKKGNWWKDLYGVEVVSESGMFVSFMKHILRWGWFLSHYGNKVSLLCVQAV